MFMDQEFWNAWKKIEEHNLWLFLIHYHSDTVFVILAKAAGWGSKGLDWLM